QRQDGGVLYVDRLSPDHAGEARNGFDLEVSDVLGEIEPHYAEPGQMPAAAALANALPGFAVVLPCEPGLIGDNVDLDAVDSAEQPLPNDAASLLHWSVRAIRHDHHQMAMLALSLLDQWGEV